MILYPSLKIDIQKFDSNDYNYFSFIPFYKNSYLKLDSEFSIALEASLNLKKGIFILEDESSFKKSLNPSNLNKHFYIDSINRWIFISQSLKKFVFRITEDEIKNFDLNKLAEKLKNIFSD